MQPGSRSHVCSLAAASCQGMQPARSACSQTAASRGSLCNQCLQLPAAARNMSATGAGDPRQRWRGGLTAAGYRLGNAKLLVVFPCLPWLAHRSLSSKVVSQYSSLMSPMAVEAVLRVMDPSHPQL
jgi:hypothetical protein